VALQKLNGIGQSIWYPHGIGLGPSLSNTTAIAATGDKFAMSGRVWTGASSGTKNITRVGFRFGSSITKAGGSALALSLQDVSLSSGPPAQPDGTQDQTVAIANASISANAWLRTNALSATRAVTSGDLLSVVIEYDGSGRLGADSITFSTIARTSGSGEMLLAVPAIFASAAWAAQSAFPVVVLEFDDGTFGTLIGSLPASAINTHSIKQDTASADEYAMAFQLPIACKVDGAYCGILVSAGTADFSVILYDGTSAMAGGTVAVDANTIMGATAKVLFVPFSNEISLVANHQYYLAIQPTQTAAAVSVYSFDVNDANQLVCHPGGVNFNYATRVDAGSWAAITTTRRLMAGLNISSLHDGTGSTPRISMGGGRQIGAAA
jgi:hypothetical protein